MQYQKIKRFELVELTIAANIPGRVYFQTQPQLRNQGDQVIFIQSIQVYTTASYSNSQVTGTIGGLPAAEIVKAALCLYVDGEENIKLIPLPQLNNLNSAAGLFQQEIQSFADLNNVVWEKSYVQFSVAAANTPYVIPFGIGYLRMKRNPESPGQWIEV